MSSEVVKKSDQQVSKPGSGQAVMESKEQSASASANVRDTLKGSKHSFHQRFHCFEPCELVKGESLTFKSLGGRQS